MAKSLRCGDAGTETTPLSPISPQPQIANKRMKIFCFLPEIDCKIGADIV